MLRCVTQCAASGKTVLAATDSMVENLERYVPNFSVTWCFSSSIHIEPKWREVQINIMRELWQLLGTYGPSIGYMRVQLPMLELR